MTVGWLDEAVGVVGAVSVALMLVPQARSNAVRQSAKGMSRGMLGLWHVAAILSVSYFAQDAAESMFAILSFVAFAFVCCILEAQVVAYDPAAERSSTAKLVVIVLSTLGFFAASALLVAVLTAVFFASHDATFVYLVGNAAPSAFFLFGFFPQYFSFIRACSTEGYAFGVTALDMVGCSANAAALLLAGDGDDRSVREGLIDSGPFLAILAGEALLLVVAIAIAVSNSSAEKRCQPECSAKSEAKLEEGSCRAAPSSAV